MMCFVVRRPQQVIHPGIHDHKALAATVLAIQHFRQQHAGFSDEIASRFDDQFHTRIAERVTQDRGKGVEIGGRLVVMIGDRKPASDVNRTHRRDAGCAHCVEQRTQPLLRVSKRCDLGNL